MVTIRPERPDDVAAVQQVYEAAFPQDAFMVFMLESGAHPPPGTLVKYAPEFAGMA